jgi:protein SCO1/2
VPERLSDAAQEACARAGGGPRLAGRRPRLLQRHPHRRRGVDPTRWFLLTGDAGQIGRLARTSYFANDDREGEGRLIHTEKVLLVDGDRRLRGVYNGTLAFDVERLLEDIATLRAYRLQES